MHFGYVKLCLMLVSSCSPDSFLKLGITVLLGRHEGGFKSFEAKVMELKEALIWLLLVTTSNRQIDIYPSRTHASSGANST